LFAGWLGGADGAAQPIKLAASTTIVSSKAIRAGCGQLCSLVSTSLASLLKTPRLLIGGRCGRLPLGANGRFSMCVSFPEAGAEGQGHCDGERHPNTWVKQGEHHATDPALTAKSQAMSVGISHHAFQ
jgi:hypothetical protein